MINKTNKMKPLICCNVGDLKEFSFENYPFEGYELKVSEDGLRPNIVILLKMKEMFKDKDLSIHSQLGRIFSCNERGIPEFSEAELDILKSEIIISNIVGIKQLNFHMKETDFTQNEIEKFNEVIDFADKYGIEMIYENHVCSEEVIFRILKNFPRVNFCLDIGHLNIAIHKGKFNMDLDKFIEKVKSRLVHIHAHNNYGDKDDHNSLDNGNFPWKKVLDKLKNQNLRKIIFENPTREQIIESKRLLEKYYAK